MNKTQCPHCATVYTISDKQYRASGGMVRCGTCRERFQAKIMNAQGKPKFDPKNAFIEPLSQSDEPPPLTVDELVKKIPKVEFKEDFTKHTPAKKEIEKRSSQELQRELDLSEAQSQMSIQLLTDHTEARKAKPTVNNSHNNNSHNNNNRTKNQKDRTDNTSLRSDTVDRRKPKPNIAKSRKSATSNARAAHRARLANRASFNRKASQLKVPARNARSFGLNNKTKFSVRFSIRQWLQKRLLGAMLSICALLLATSLIYQLWLKQIIFWPDNEGVQKTLAPLTTLVTESLAAVDIQLPVRRNLSKLELLSARTEAHPTRSSTVLLRVSLINHANIVQPLPWLELSLTDADGRTVSRRTLAPEDYIFNNRIDPRIGPNELKKVAIELLAFPKQATGYELKLLNK